MPTSKRKIFYDGEGIVHTDFNAAQQHLLSKIIDQKQFFRALRSSVAVGPAGWDVNAVSGGEYTTPTFLDDHLWSIGGGPLVDTSSPALSIRWGPGMVGQYSSSGPPGAEPEDPRFRWVHLDGGSVAIAATSADRRWDVLSVNIAEADGDSETRDFEDAETRSLTTQALNKSKIWTGTVNYTAGTEGAAPPSIPAGDVPMSYIVIESGGSALEAVYNVQVPIGGIHTITTFPGLHAYTDFSGTNHGSGRVEAGASNEQIRFYCPLAPTFGRLIGLRMIYLLSAGFADVAMGYGQPGSGALTFAGTFSFASALTIDGTHQTTTLNLLNTAPFIPFNDPNNYPSQPLVPWGRGFGGNLSSGFGTPNPFVEVNSGSPGDYVDAVSWIFAAG